VQVVNTATGKVIGSVPPESQVPSPAGQSSASAPPLIADVGGEQVALAGYVVQLAGHGTTPSSLAVELDAVTADARLAWDIIASLPGQSGQTPFLVGNPDVDITGMAGSTVIVAAGDSDDGYSTVAFDAASRKPLWQSQAFLASAVVGGTVIGTTDSSTPSGSLGSRGQLGNGALNLTGLDATQEKTEWQLSESITAASVQQAGPGLILAEVSDADSGDAIISVLQAATGKGKTITSQPQDQIDSPPPWTCAYAGQSVVVCDDGIGSYTQAFAIDGVTGDTLWQLPDPTANRTALTITAVYNGEVYGNTPASPVVLNARTGQDVNDSPGVAPVAVDPEIGIAISPASGQLEAYPAIAS
jgi:hypothetical protein